MRFISLFSGIEAASVAWEPLGWTPVAFAEIEAFPCALLAHYYPNVPNLGDVTKITHGTIQELGALDVVIGGFPCQDVSVAGRREGLTRDDGSSTRSGLFYDAVRIADWSGAESVVIENVPGLFSSSGGRDFAAVVGALAGCEFDVPRDGWRDAGAVAGPKGLVEWCVLDAQYFGLAQRRRRVFIVRRSGNWRDAPPLFLEPYRLQGHPAPRRETRKGVAGTLTRSALDGSGACGGDGRAELMVAHSLRADGFDAGEDGTGRGTPLVPDVAWCLQDRDAKGPDSDTKEGHLIPVLAPPLRAGGSSTGVHGPGTDADTAAGLIPVLADPICANEQRTYTHEGENNFRLRNVIAFDETQITHPENRSNPQPGDPAPAMPRQGRPPTIAFTCKDYGADAGTDVSPTLRSMNEQDGNANAGGQVAIVEPFMLAVRGRGDARELEYRQDGTANALMTPNGGRDGMNVGAVAFDTYNQSVTGDVTQTLCSRGDTPGGNAHLVPALATRYAVRRLTPRECEILQGFRPDYTAIPLTRRQRKIISAEMAAYYRRTGQELSDADLLRLAKDGPRYKSLGNSMAVPCIFYIGQRLEFVIAIMRERAA